MIGKTFGNYRFLEKIGEGGVGEVYRATDLLLDRPVAIKLLRRDLAAEPKLLERFRAEAQTLARLNHPNIALLYALAQEDETFLMIMEFVSGKTFAALAKESRGMSVERALPLFAQTLAGIGYAHERGIVHRDIKPSNIMLSDSGTVKVMDFGIARALGSNRLTRIGHMVGTLQYMSPEQVRGEETDARSDIYSLGILLYDLLTGQVPFCRKSDYDVMRAHVEQPPPPPRDLAPGIPPDLERALLRSLEKDPEDRYATTGEFLAALELGAGLPSDETRVRPILSEVLAPAAAPRRPDEAPSTAVAPDDPAEDPTVERPTATAPLPPALAKLPAPARRAAIALREGARAMRRAPVWQRAATAAVLVLATFSINWVLLSGRSAPAPTAPAPRIAAELPPALPEPAPAPYALDPLELLALEALGIAPPRAEAPRTAAASEEPTGAPARAAEESPPAAAGDSEGSGGASGWVIRR